MLFTGGTGRGKSTACLRFLESWYEFYFKEDFPIKHVCNNLAEAIILASGFKRKGEGMMIEELSVHASARDSLTTQNKMWNKFVDICRVKQILIVANAPHISFIDKHFILMCQVWVDCLHVNFKKEVVVTHPLWLQTSPHKKEPYKHRFTNEKGEAIDYVLFKKPSEELTKQYETLKEESNNKIFNEVILRIRKDEQIKLKKLGIKVMTPRQQEAYDLYLQGVTSEQGAKKMGLKYIRKFTELVRGAKKRLKSQEPIQKTP